MGCSLEKPFTRGRSYDSFIGNEFPKKALCRNERRFQNTRGAGDVAQGPSDVREMAEGTGFPFGSNEVF